MRRIRDLAMGAALGAAAIAAAVAGSSTGFLDPVAISPQLYTVKFENDRVRVLEYRLQAGRSEPLHSHHPGVVIAFGDSTVKTTQPDGAAATHAVHSGDVLWRDEVTHAVQNVGSTEAHYFAVELKSPPR
jgi:hypothetical protein